MDQKAGQIGDIPVYASLEDLPEAKGIVIDFTSPAGTVHAAQFCAAHGMPCVLCSTGLSKEDEAVVEQASEKVLVFRSANMSVGINVLIELARRATKLFDGESDVVNQGWISLQEAGVVIDRNLLAARLIKELRLGLELFEQEGLAPYLPRWEKLDNFIHRPVKLIIGDKEIYGISRGIDAQGALLLEQDGVIKAWVGGEISLRSAE